MKRLAILGIFLLISLPAVAADTWTGRCIGITDGDTVTVLKDKERIKIRLHGIDCPE